MHIHIYAGLTKSSGQSKWELVKISKRGSQTIKEQKSKVTDRIPNEVTAAVGMQQQATNERDGVRVGKQDEEGEMDMTKFKKPEGEEEKKREMVEDS